MRTPEDLIANAKRSPQHAIGALDSCNDWSPGPRLKVALGIAMSDFAVNSTVRYKLLKIVLESGRDLNSSIPATEVVHLILNNLIGEDRRAEAMLTAIGTSQTITGAAIFTHRNAPYPVVSAIAKHFDIGNPMALNNKIGNRKAFYKALSYCANKFGWENEDSGHMIASDAQVRKEEAVFPLAESDTLPESFLVKFHQSKDPFDQEVLNHVKVHPSVLMSSAELVGAAVASEDPFKYAMDFMNTGAAIAKKLEFAKMFITEASGNACKFTTVLANSNDPQIFALCIQVLRGDCGMFWRHCESFLQALTKNPLVLNYLIMVSRLLKDHHVFQKADPQFIGLVNDISTPRVNHVKEEEDDLGLLATWYGQGMTKEASLKGNIGALMTSLMLAAPGVGMGCSSQTPKSAKPNSSISAPAATQTAPKAAPSQQKPPTAKPQATPAQTTPAQQKAPQVSGGDFRQTMLAQIEANEGYREIAYKDTKKIWTIGYGFNLEDQWMQRTLSNLGYDAVSYTHLTLPTKRIV